MIIASTHHLPLGFVVEFSAVVEAGAVKSLAAELDPKLPTSSQHKTLLPGYLRARDQFLRRLVQQTGITIACIDVPASSEGSR